jgi:hypothetical protein
VTSVLQVIQSTDLIADVGNPNFGIFVLSNPTTYITKRDTPHEDNRRQPAYHPLLSTN